MKATIPSFITSSGLCPDRVGGPEKSFVSGLEENLCLGRVDEDRERLGSVPVPLTVAAQSEIRRIEKVRTPLGTLGLPVRDACRAFLGPRP
ncbi:hypothetical protein BHM03_00012487 [Ensete ventricosum]|uniref:Uncharacterized protein n=1 Tax=Ensete ventricosum TaxID=4639 RepID=A0A427A518_ENSVE|nr:hypothetical protein B296_00026442 [Ensete ventricosum]RZR85485.1 hypothetical protein BHM03_00012487 [Ensete ventricosum]